MNADARVDGVLLPNEREVRRTRPDVGAWWVSVLAPRLALALVVMAASMRSNQSLIVWLGVLFGLGVAGSVVVSGLRLQGTRYVLTSFRAIRVSGVLRHDCEWLTWSKVTDVSVARSMSDRVMRTATIQIHSANEASAFRALNEVPHPMAFADTIATLVSTKRSGD